MVNIKPVQNNEFVNLIKIDYIETSHLKELNAASDSDWTYAKHGIKHSSFSTKDIVNLLENGWLEETDLVWKEGYSEWKPIRESEIISLPFTSFISPLAKDKVNNTYIWLLS